MTDLAIVASALVSPLGRTAEEHAFLLRAEAAPLATGAFVDDDETFLPVFSCPWIGADRPLSSRLRILGLQAASTALRGVPDEVRPSRVLLVHAADRPGFRESDVAPLRSTLKAAVRNPDIVTFRGDAGTMSALEAARAELRSEGSVLVLAVDSYVALRAIDAWSASRFDPWGANLGPIGEAAVAFVLVTRERAHRLGLSTEGTFVHAATTSGSARDDNDVDEDGAALSSLLANLPMNGGRFGLALGPADVDPLRRREWELAFARQNARFEIDAEVVSAESVLGRVGAASGALHLALGAAMRKHAAYRVDRASPPRGEHALAWATSPDGLRGVAVVRGGS
ncbi:hypothetical protein [Polyangium jinanense]|uniref:Uncharacterized protein n=1 Tax=Polyangium jinanense TaxID=2829994 RepID=A0A9X4AS72_9BACT|nr:hypothetical protein [Polyangium jinanense]MDC3955579.1 hypothetical protein [Polyangium jinanense]MDC3982221.1 hypothetical protein [Polyangium jinanense]